MRAHAMFVCTEGRHEKRKGEGGGRRVASAILLKRQTGAPLLAWVDLALAGAALHRVSAA